MTRPVVHQIIRGQTLDLEIRVVGEVLTGSAVRITADSGVSVPEIAVTIASADTVTIYCDTTASFLLGNHRLRLWVDWLAGDSEPVLDMQLVVRPEIAAWAVGADIIDGGAAGTIHEESVDGGDA